MPPAEAPRRIALSGTGTSTAAYQVELDWDAPPSSGVTVSGYHVYRAPSGSTSYTLLTSSASSIDHVHRYEGAGGVDVITTRSPVWTPRAWKARRPASTLRRFPELVTEGICQVRSGPCGDDGAWLAPARTDRSEVVEPANGVIGSELSRRLPPEGNHGSDAPRLCAARARLPCRNGSDSNSIFVSSSALATWSHQLHMLCVSSS